MAQETQTLDGEGEGREFQKGGDICIPMAASFEVCGKQQNSVKQLSFNKKIKDNQQGSIV